MYLERRHYIGNKFNKPKERLRLIIPKQSNATFPIPHIDSSKIDSIIEEVAYWRKANAIHNWFVQNVQDGEDDCKQYYVSNEQLKELLDLCDKVLTASKLIPGKIVNDYTYKNGVKKPIIEKSKIIKDSTIAQKLLPTQSSFFFGGTEYDEYYYKDIENTKKMLTKALEHNNGDFYYQSSW